MKQPIRESTLLEQLAENNHASFKEVESEMIEVWDNMMRSPDPVVRKLAIAMKDNDLPPLPEKLIAYLTTLAGIENMIPFIRAGYSERDYERFCQTDLASVLTAKYDRAELFRLSVEEFVKLRNSGKI